MDLNYLFLRQQVERSFAKAARSKAAREAHEEMARAYELAIERRSGGKVAFSSSPKGADALDDGQGATSSDRPRPTP